jgi:hypothetical protein
LYDSPWFPLLKNGLTARNDSVIELATEIKQPTKKKTAQQLKLTLLNPESIFFCPRRSVPRTKVLKETKNAAFVFIAFI